MQILQVVDNRKDGALQQRLQKRLRYRISKCIWKIIHLSIDLNIFLVYRAMNEKNELQTA